MSKELQKSKIIELYTIGNKSINQIAKELNISWGTVKKCLIEEDIEIISNRNQYSCNNNINENLFKEINDSNSAYWLGFLYADGNIRDGNRNEISLELKEEDFDTIKDFHEYCGNKNSIRKHVIKRNNKEYYSYISSFSSKQVKENLINLGCVPKKSLILKCPSNTQVPKEYFYDFLRGYIDGDGYIQYDFDKYRYRIVICGTKEMLQGIITRCEWFEYCSITKDNKSSIYTLTISNKENVYNILSKLYENSKYHLKRKFDIFQAAKTKLGI